MTPAEVERYLREGFPLDETARAIRVERFDQAGIRCRLEFHDRFLRPGGTVSGPVLMALADTAMYLALLARRGEQAKSAATSNLSIHFLSRPSAADVIAEAEVIRGGRTLVVGTVTLSSEGKDDPVALATVTYALPRAT